MTAFATPLPPATAPAGVLLPELPVRPRGLPPRRDGLRAHATGQAARVAPPAAEPAPLDDAALVARCLDGDAQAWETLVRRYQRLVLAVARRVGLDDHEAADVFQTVFSRLVQHLPRIAEPARLQAWIVTTTKREALLQRRRGQRTVSMTRAEGARGEGDEWELIDDCPGAEQVLDDLQQLDRLRQALDRLDPASRDLMLLLFRDDEERLSYDEIARRLAIPVGSIGPTRSRCLAKLRRLVC
jgi:RNA polymerase sigma factor (sigma-70 family)